MPRHLTRLAVLAVALAAAAPYVRVTGDYFIQDDFGVVGLLSQKPASYFPRWFVSNWMEDIWGYTPDEVRPFPAVTYQIAALGGAASPVANHLINIAFHAINALLVFGLARSAAGLRTSSALAAALVFAWLPMQAESVAWITGRVDSMPACFYMASVLLFVRWRATAARSLYVASVVCCFVALFSKQNTITLPVALVLYDLCVQRVPMHPMWRALAPYLPYVALTAAYMALRWALFGEVAREGMMTTDRLGGALVDLSTHLKRMVYGEPGVAIAGVWLGLTVATAVAVISALAFRFGRRDLRPLVRVAIYFVAVWIALGAVPTLVAGYASPRHMYLASAGWAIGIGIAVEAMLQTRLRWIRWAAAGSTAALLAAYALQLHGVVSQWRARAAVSRQAVLDVQREALAAPEGTLIVAGAPRSSWDFAIPHSLRPPFTETDLTRRVSVISHSSLHCCAAEQWDRHTRGLLRDWRARADRPPVVALYWNPQTAALSRLTDAQESYLRFVMELLPDTGSSAALDEAILDTFAELVVPRGSRPAP